MKKAWFFIEFLFALLSVLLGLAACYYIFPKRVDHDVWDILTAIGTVGAAVAAVWIATNEARRRRKSEMEVAELAVAGMAFRLLHDHSKLQVVMLWLENQAVSASFQEFMKQAKQLEELCAWRAEDLLPLVPLPGRCAFKLAMAADQIRFCATYLQTSGHARAAITSPERTVFVANMHKILNEAAEAIGQVNTRCREIYRAAGSDRQ